MEPSGLAPALTLALRAVPLPEGEGRSKPAIFGIPLQNPWILCRRYCLQVQRGYPLRQGAKSADSCSSQRCEPGNPRPVSWYSDDLSQDRSSVRLQKTVSGNYDILDAFA